MRLLIKGTDILEAALPAGILLPGPMQTSNSFVVHNGLGLLLLLLVCSPAVSHRYWRHASAACGTENHALVPMKCWVFAPMQWPAASLCKVFGFPSERPQLAPYCRQFFLSHTTMWSLPCNSEREEKVCLGIWGDRESRFWQPSGLLIESQELLSAFEWCSPGWAKSEVLSFPKADA